ncbi:MAG: cyclic nucleotide-binding domain-containing protein [Actinomycetota bacterium]|nr:cyclic nucleotide-binding domain-containing protein [Actinomycetota bacterium]MDH5223926.1 cyclic nucleotide-binding domain-containing protein [Actinomycetota bacterium]MDH5313135.1 cyclic nucleotide-binding domain-containing protein [Actinomycetota bacterium]
MDAKELEAVPLFAGLSKKERTHIAQHADVVDLPAGYHLVDQGAFAHEFFVLLSGSVEVTQDGKHLTDLEPGDFFGEVALVEHDRRTASVVASTPISAIVMHQRDFDAMQRGLPEVAETIHQAVRARLPNHPAD